jgi:hypothetical protein
VLPSSASLFVKGPSAKEAYRLRFSAQWLASACKHALAQRADADDRVDAACLPVIATRCIALEGRYYLLMHDVSRTGAVNVQDWLAKRSIANIGLAPLAVRADLFWALVFRSVFAVRDTNFRNIMTDGAHLFSVDEETAFDVDGSAPAKTAGAPRLFSKLPAGAAAYLVDMFARARIDCDDAQEMDVAASVRHILDSSDQFVVDGTLVRLARAVHLEDTVSKACLSALSNRIRALREHL